MKLCIFQLQLTMARKEIGISELSRISGISQPSVSRYVRGKSNPSLKQIGKIAKALEVDVCDIVEKKDTKKEQTR